MIAFADVAIGTGGVLGCSKCRSAQQRASYELAEIRARLLDVAATWEFGPGPNVCFTGMEPFTHPALPAIVSAAVEPGFERIRLRTDAGALASPGNAAGIVAAGVRHLEIVLLGPDPATHDGLTGRPGLFDMAQAGVAAVWDAVNAAGCEFFVSGYVPLCIHTIESLPATVATLAAQGATAVCLDSSGAGLGSRGQILIEAAMETATVNSMAVFVRGGSGAPSEFVAPWTDLADD